MSVLVIHFLPVFTRSLSMVELGVLRTVSGLYFSMGNIITSPMLRLRNSSATPPLAILIVFSIICCEINWERQSASLRRPSGVFLTLYLLSYTVLIYICGTSVALSDMSSLHTLLLPVHLPRADTTQPAPVRSSLLLFLLA